MQGEGSSKASKSLQKNANGSQKSADKLANGERDPLAEKKSDPQIESQADESAPSKKPLKRIRKATKEVSIIQCPHIFILLWTCFFRSQDLASFLLRNTCWSFWWVFWFDYCCKAQERWPKSFWLNQWIWSSRCSVPSYSAGFAQSTIVSNLRLAWSQQLYARLAYAIDKTHISSRNQFLLQSMISIALSQKQQPLQLRKIAPQKRQVVERRLL